MRIERYGDSASSEWDDFVRNSKNGTFLLLRGYMDHHRDRFPDSSLIVRDPDDEIAALLPGHLLGSTYASHAGLTYGGFLTSAAMKLPLMLRVFEAAIEYLKDTLGANRLLYKTVPHIYHRVPAEEDRFVLQRLRASWLRSGMLAVIPLRDRPAYQERRRRSIKKGASKGIAARQTDDFAAYWSILSELLAATYGVSPVHSLDQIELLRQRFPDRIKLFAAYDGALMLAGVVVFESARVARFQYIASSSEGRAVGALDVLFDHLIGVIYTGKEYIDLGTSDDGAGSFINRGLIDQKEGFGARCVAMDQYEIDLDSWQPGMLTGALK